MHSCCSFGEPIKDTKILACCKSAETSVRVTVTPLTRGSCNSNKIVSAATSRTTSATRAVRCAFMVLPSNLDLVFQKLRHGVDAQCLGNLPQRHLDAVDLRPDHGDTQNRQLAMVLMLNLGHRDVELVAESV